MLKLKLVRNKLFSQLNVLFDLSSSLFSDIVFFADVIGKPKHQFMLKHKKIISTLYSLRDIFANTASDNDWLYYMFSIFCSPSYIGETTNITKRKTSHVSCSLHTKPTSLLYSQLHAIWINHFTFINIKVPPYLRLPLEKLLIQWFSPSLNTQHNSDFKTNISVDPTIPLVLKKALTNFKSSSTHSSASYNINCDNFNIHIQ